MNKLGNEISSPWLVFLKRNPNADIRFFCFHYGGGSASAFRSWAGNLPDNVELIAVQLPGREGRFQEPFVTGYDELIESLASEIQPYLNKPYVVFGHSLGTINSFEWLREIKRRGLRSPLLYIPSGMQAPHLEVDEPPISELPEDEFINELVTEYGDSLGALLSQKELREVFIPQLRADFGLLESYRYREDTKLDCPILAFAGTEETDIGNDDLSAWSQHTSASFDSKRFPGDHFFIHSAEAEVLTTIRDEFTKLLNRLYCSTNTSLTSVS